MILTPPRKASPSNRLEDSIRPFVRRLKQIPSRRLQHTPYFPQVSIGVWNVLEHVEAEDHIECSSVERQRRAAYLTDRQRAELFGRLGDPIRADFGADDIEASQMKQVEQRAPARADFEHPRARRQQSAFVEKSQIGLEVAELGRGKRSRRLGETPCHSASTLWRGHC